MSLSDYGAWLTAIATINIIMLIDPGISSVCSQRLSRHFNDDSDIKRQILLNFDGGNCGNKNVNSVSSQHSALSHRD